MTSYREIKMIEVRSNVFFSLLFLLLVPFGNVLAEENTIDKVCPEPNIQDFITSGAQEMDESDFLASDLELVLESAELYSWLLDVLGSGEWLSVRYRTQRSKKGIAIEIQNRTAWVKIESSQESLGWDLAVDEVRLNAEVFCKVFKYNLPNAIVR